MCLPLNHESWKRPSFSYWLVFYGTSLLTSPLSRGPLSCSSLPICSLLRAMLDEFYFDLSGRFFALLALVISKHHRLHVAGASIVGLALLSRMFLQAMQRRRSRDSVRRRVFWFGCVEMRCKPCLGVGIRNLLFEAET